MDHVIKHESVSTKVAELVMNHLYNGSPKVIHFAFDGFSLSLNNENNSIDRYRDIFGIFHVIYAHEEFFRAYVDLINNVPRQSVQEILGYLESFVALIPEEITVSEVTVMKILGGDYLRAINVALEQEKGIHTEIRCPKSRAIIRLLFDILSFVYNSKLSIKNTFESFKSDIKVLEHLSFHKCENFFEAEGDELYDLKKLSRLDLSIWEATVNEFNGIHKDYHMLDSLLLLKRKYLGTF